MGRWGEIVIDNIILLHFYDTSLSPKDQGCLQVVNLLPSLGLGCL